MRRFFIITVLALGSVSEVAFSAEPASATSVRDPGLPDPAVESMRAAHSPGQASAAGAGTPAFVGLPSLDEILELAQERAPGLRASEAGYKASSSALVGAKRLPFGNPTLTVFVERGDNNATKDVMIDGQLELPFEIWGQRGKRIAEADAWIGVNRINVEVAKAEALADAVASYGQVVVATERVLVLEEALLAARQEAAVFEARLLVQDAILRDARMATMEVARLEVLLGEAKADQVQGLAILSRLTGNLFSMQAGETRAVPPGLGRLDVVRADLKTAPMVREAEATAKYYRSTSERVTAEGKPPVSLLLRLGRGDLAETRVGAGVVVGFPFFQRNQGDAAIAAANAERAATTAAVYAEALARSAEGLRNEFRALESARDTVDRVALPAAREAVEQAEQMQKAGKSDLLPILVSRRDFAALRLRRLDILARQWRALSDLVRMTGVEP